MQKSQFTQKEIAKFSEVSTKWWQKDGPCKTLHALNPIRTDFIKQNASLKNTQVLDVGCGGGILAESLAKLGAQVTAIDGSAELIDVAKNHAKINNLAINYIVATAEELQLGQNVKFDVITCMELLEHLENPQQLLSKLKYLLKPNGKLFLSTINRTCKSFAQAIVAAEYILQLLPKNTHHYQQFIQPAELAQWLRSEDLHLQKIVGVKYNPWSNTATFINSPKVNYLAYVTSNNF